VTQDIDQAKKVGQTNAAAGFNLLSYLPSIAGIVAIGLATSYFIFFRGLAVSDEPDAWGQFGDYMGGLLNPLISLFTLLIALSVWKLQKTELLETRKAVTEQGKTAEQQRREQRFFDFLNIYRSTVDSIEFEVITKAGAYVSLKGKRAFKHLTSRSHHNRFFHIVDLFETGDWEKWFATEKIVFAESHWSSESPILDHYFRVVFTLLQEAEPTLKEDRWRYMKLLRAQLSRDEVNLLAMNLLFDEEGKKMRALVSCYGMLKHMPQNTLRKLAEQDLPKNSFGRKWSARGEASINPGN